jgi:hypothetical protein
MHASSTNGTQRDARIFVLSSLWPALEQTRAPLESYYA